MGCFSLIFVIAISVWLSTGAIVAQPFCFLVSALISFVTLLLIRRKYQETLNEQIPSFKAELEVFSKTYGHTDHGKKIIWSCMPIFSSSVAAASTAGSNISSVPVDDIEQAVLEVAGQVLLPDGSEIVDFIGGSASLLDGGEGLDSASEALVEGGAEILLIAGALLGAAALITTGWSALKDIFTVPKEQRVAASQLKEKWQSLQDLKTFSSTMTFFIGIVIIVNVVFFFMNY